MTTSYENIRTVVATKQGLCGDHSSNSFIVACYGDNSDEVTLVRLNFVQEKNEWKTVLKRKDSSGSGEFVNIFHLKGDQALLVREHTVLVMSKAFEVSTSTDF